MEGIDFLFQGIVYRVGLGSGDLSGGFLLSPLLPDLPDLADQTRLVKYGIGILDLLEIRLRFPKAFPWFSESSYWERHVLALREQIAAVEEGPLALL